jgi:hypothetical protein
MIGLWVITLCRRVWTRGGYKWRAPVYTVMNNRVRQRRGICTVLTKEMMRAAGRVTSFVTNGWKIVATNSSSYAM